VAVVVGSANWRHYFDVALTEEHPVLVRPGLKQVNASTPGPARGMKATTCPCTLRTSPTELCMWSYARLITNDLPLSVVSLFTTTTPWICRELAPPIENSWPSLAEFFLSSCRTAKLRYTSGTQFGCFPTLNPRLTVTFWIRSSAQDARWEHVRQRTKSRCRRSL